MADLGEIVGESGLTRLKNFFGFETGEGLESFDHTGEDEAADDKEGHADDKETPPGDAAHVLVIEFLPITGGRVEVVEEIKGEAKVHHSGEAEGAEKQEGRSPEEVPEFGFLVVDFHLLVNASVVEDVFIVNEGIKKRSRGLVGEEEKGAEDEGLDGFFDSEEKRGVLAGFGIVVGKEIDRDDAGEENVAHAHS